jgi:FMN phosphatase YigB (HAD superfamily)
MEKTKEVKRVRVVLFDLDNVLYCSPKLAEETEKRISEFFRHELGFKGDSEIEDQKKQYFDQYGLVLKGLLMDHPERTPPLLICVIDETPHHTTLGRVQWMWSCT